MVSTARMARSRTPNFRCGTGQKNYRNTGNALFTGPFYYINPCIKNVVLIDPACGTAGFLVSASEYVRSHYESTMTDAQWNHFSSTMFSGFDTDPTMLRISAMNVLVSFQTVYCLVAIKPIKPSAKNWQKTNNCVLLFPCHLAYLNHMQACLRVS